MTTVRDIKVSITVHPIDFDSDLEQNIKNRARNIVTGRQISGVGFVKEVVSVDNNITGGSIISGSGISKFTVCLRANIYLPVVGDKITAKVKDVSIHGYYLDTPIEVFVGTGERPTVKKGDTAKVKIINVSWNKEKYIVIGK
jgi:DNA-directed RNA polymerase subunit E'/Rpb7